MPISRAERDYALPRLTLTEAARILGIERGTLWIWINERVRPTPKQYSTWNNDAVPLPETLIRLYLTDRQVLIRAGEPGAAVQEPTPAPVRTPARPRGPEALQRSKRATR